MDLEMWPQRLSFKLVFGSELPHSHLGFYGAQKEVIPFLLLTADPGSAVTAENVERSILTGIGSAEQGCLQSGKIIKRGN